MIKVVSVEQMQAIEAAADKDGISFETMFERVSMAAANRIMEHLEAIPEPRVAILVGSGNNGGDGLVTAARLAELSEDIEIGVYLVKERDEDDQLKAVRDADIFVAEAADDQQFRVLRNMVANAHIVVDAVFGIGLRLPLEGDITKVMRNVQQALDTPPLAPPEGVLVDPEIPAMMLEPRQYVIALDCPSGVDCDTGEVDKLAIRADETITFIAVKQGLLMPPAAEHVGKLFVATLGIPEDLDELKAVETAFIDGQRAQDMLPPRPALSHKGTFGKAMIAAGSVNYTGAAGLAAYGAYRSGAGLVTVAAPMGVIGGLASQMLEVTWIVLPQNMGVISEAAAEVLAEEIEDYQALLIGPGMGQEDTTKEMLLKLFEQTKAAPRRQTRKIGFAGLKKLDEVNEKAAKDENENDRVTLPPLVLDADALNLLATVDEWWSLLPHNTIVTPHPGEMARLCGCETSDVQAARLEMAREKAAAWDTVIVLKGAHTVVAAPDGQAAVLPFKSSALATAGTGDVLSGVVVGLLAQGMPAYEAAVAGAYIHGSAGTIAASYSGNPHSVVAGDLLDMIGEALTLLS